MRALEMTRYYHDENGNLVSSDLSEQQRNEEHIAREQDWLRDEKWRNDPARARRSALPAAAVIFTLGIVFGAIVASNIVFGIFTVAAIATLISGHSK
jgi:hypothetical protein